MSDDQNPTRPTPHRPPVRVTPLPEPKAVTLEQNVEGLVRMYGPAMIRAIVDRVESAIRAEDAAEKNRRREDTGQ